MPRCWTDKGVTEKEPQAGGSTGSHRSLAQGACRTARVTVPTSHSPAHTYQAATVRQAGLQVLGPPVNKTA